MKPGVYSKLRQGFRLRFFEYLIETSPIQSDRISGAIYVCQPLTTGKQPIGSRKSVTASLQSEPRKETRLNPEQMPRRFPIEISKRTVFFSIRVSFRLLSFECPIETAPFQSNRIPGAIYVCQPLTTGKQPVGFEEIPHGEPPIGTANARK
jgi:hypothetical protein